MKMKWIALAPLMLALAVIGLIAGASELGGEVVVIYTTDADGSQHATSIWVVEDEGQVWVRSGSPTSSWLARLRANPKVLLERAGERAPYLATPDESRRDRVNQLIAIDYPWADAIISGSMDPSDAVPVHLVPR